MSYAEVPAETEAQQILAELAALRNATDAIQHRLDNQAIGLNALGQNVNWLTENVKGIFAMLNSPQMMAQIGSLMGGMTNAGPHSDPSES